MGEMGQLDITAEKHTQDAIASDRMAAALKKIGPHEVIKTHDDGDLTVKDAAGCLHVVTTEGDLFTDYNCDCAFIEKLAALLGHLDKTYLSCKKVEK